MQLNNVELVIWNSPNDDGPSVIDTRDRLTSAGLAGCRCHDLPATTAFRRAADSMRTKTTLVRPFKADGELFVQLDDEAASGDSLERSLVGVWKLTEDGPTQVRRYTPEVSVEFSAAYRKAARNYNWSDITKTIQTILVTDGIGCYSPRNAGGVYFVPTDTHCRTLLDKLETFCGSSGVQLLRYAVPDTSLQRMAVADAVAQGIDAEIAVHAEAVKGYSAETNPTAVNARRSAISQTQILVARLTSHLNGHAHGMQEGLAALITHLDELALQAASSGQAGTRRITRMAVAV